MASGSVLGRGNLTYKKLAPGRHQVMVSKDGYTPWKGTVTLVPGETATLNVNLEKEVTASKSSGNSNQKSTKDEPQYSATDFYDSGRAQMANNNYTAAIKDLSEALRLQPSMAEAYTARAECYEELGNGDKAEFDYIRSGELLVLQKKYQQAQDLFDLALTINKRSIAALINKADNFRRMNRVSDAIETYRQALRYDDDVFRAQFELGKLYFALGKNKDADKRLRKSHELNPNSPEVYQYLMLNYFARDDFSKVKETYAEFKQNVAQDAVQSFKENPKHSAILRVVGEYDRP